MNSSSIAIIVCFSLVIILVVIAVTFLVLAGQQENPNLSFPEGFEWGMATASYQVEGGITQYGRTPSIWDTFCETLPPCPEESSIGCCGEVADNFINLYKEDIQRAKTFGCTCMRISLSWSRMMTWDQTLKKMIPNPQGIEIYRTILQTMISNGIKPLVTLYHWDLPLALQTEIDSSNSLGKGWLTPSIIPLFVDYAELAFQEFGNLVPYWFTFNEPWTFCYFGYETDINAPGVSSLPQENRNKFAYEAGRNVLLCHATVVKLFATLRTQNKIPSDSKISIILNLDWNMPDDPKLDVDAATRRNTYVFNWFLQPLLTGEYPEVMVTRAQGRLSSFSNDEQTLLKESLIDGFIGLNHYTTYLVTDCNSPRSTIPCSDLTQGWASDLAVDNTKHPADSVPSNCPWLHGYPEGFRKTLQYVHKLAPKLKIFCTENGWCGDNEIDNQKQLDYYKSYLQVLQQESKRLPIMGYVAWALVDNYEWGTYKARFGLFYVDYKTQERIPKTAAFYFQKVATNNRYYA